MGPDMVGSEMYVGTSFGELAMLTDVKRTATVRAVEDCELYRLSQEDLRDSFRDVPAVFENMRMKVIAKVFKNNTKKSATKARDGDEAKEPDELKQLNSKLESVVAALGSLGQRQGRIESELLAMNRPPKPGNRDLEA